MRTRTRLAAVALALVAPLTVTACGGAEDSGDEVEQEVEQEDGEEEDD